MGLQNIFALLYPNLSIFNQVDELRTIVYYIFPFCEPLLFVFNYLTKKLDHFGFI